MGWDGIKARWKRLQVGLRRRTGAGAGEERVRVKQLADWLERRHKADPIHK